MKPPSKIFSRSIKLAGMASQLALKEAGTRVKGGFKKLNELNPEVVKLRIEQAKIIKDNLSQLKGAAQKAGQLLSINATDFLPPEAIAILSELQASATAMPIRTVESILVSELGKEKVKQFKDFSQKAEASASIGQVHSAFLDGEKVAVKIQYPSIAETIDSDLALLAKVGQTAMKISSKEMDLKPVFKELAEVLHQEANYVLEKDHLEEFRNRLEKDPLYVVPKTFPEHCSSKVLTMSWEDGIPLGKWIKQNPSADQKNQVADLILDLYCKEFFEWGFVQTDPNFANYLIRETNSKIQLVCLDFGAALRYEKEYRDIYVELLRRIEAGNSKEIIEYATTHRFVDPKEDPQALAAFVEMLEVSMEPFREDQQPFDFTNKAYLEKSRQAIQNFSFSAKHSVPIKKIIFLHRKLGGIFQLLKQMEIKKDIRPFWQNMLSPH